MQTPAEAGINPSTQLSPAPQPKKLRIVPIVIGIVVIVALALTGYLFFQNQKSDSPTSPQQVTPSPYETSQQEILDSSTANWLPYTNHQYAFSTKYHPSAPPTEEVGNRDVGQFTFMSKVNFGPNPPQGDFSYSLEVNQQKTVENYRQELIGHITDAIDSQELVTINGLEWTKFNYQLFVNNQNLPVTLAFITQGDFGYAVTAKSQDITQILSTFAFLEDTSTWKAYTDSSHNFSINFPPDGGIEPNQNSSYTRIQNYSNNDNEPGLKPGEFYIEIYSQPLNDPETSLSSACERVFKSSTLINQSFYTGEVSAGGEPGGIVKGICFISDMNDFILIKATENHPNTPLADQILSTFKFVQE